MPTYAQAEAELFAVLEIDVSRAAPDRDNCALVLLPFPAGTVCICLASPESGRLYLARTVGPSPKDDPAYQESVIAAWAGPAKAASRRVRDYRIARIPGLPDLAVGPDSLLRRARWHAANSGRDTLMWFVTRERFGGFPGWQTHDTALHRPVRFRSQEAAQARADQLNAMEAKPPA